MVSRLCELLYSSDGLEVDLPEPFSLSIVDGVEESSLYVDFEFQEACQILQEVKKISERIENLVRCPSKHMLNTTPNDTSSVESVQSSLDKLMENFENLNTQEQSTEFQFQHKSFEDDGEDSVKLKLEFITRLRLQDRMIKLFRAVEKRESKLHDIAKVSCNSQALVKEKLFDMAERSNL